MFDAKKLLDQLIGGVESRTGPLTQPGESLGDAARRHLESGKAATGLSGQGSGLAVGALAGGALGLLLGSKQLRKTVGSLGGTAVKVGGLALVAGLAYKAYDSWQKGKAAPAVAGGPGGPLLPPPAGSPYDPAAAPEGADMRAEEILVAMIAATKADGHIDRVEEERIFARLDGLGLDSEARTFVMRELSAPLDVERIVAMATTPAAAAQVYAASLLAMDPDTPAERAYLNLLAARLGLDAGLAHEIEQATAAALDAR